LTVVSPDTSKSESNNSSDHSKVPKAEADLLPRAEADLVALWVCMQADYPVSWKSYYHDASMNLKAMLDTKRSELDALFEEQMKEL
jgi:hypothetical protein